MTDELTFPFGKMIDECTICGSQVTYHRESDCDHDDWHVINLHLSTHPCSKCTETHSVILSLIEPRVSDRYVQEIYRLDIEFDVPNDLGELDNE